ncbi:hypothetical protein T484DRAFT_1860871 [Baffinella frigidus]|nr:hypothetical protein T484DRAFT_1860871 [Cryptophyta sp. CCMP2293]
MGSKEIILDTPPGKAAIGKSREAPRNVDSEAASAGTTTTINLVVVANILQALEGTTENGKRLLESGVRQSMRTISPMASKSDIKNALERLVATNVVATQIVKDGDAEHRYVFLSEDTSRASPSGLLSAIGKLRSSILEVVHDSEERTPPGSTFKEVWEAVSSIGSATRSLSRTDFTMKFQELVTQKLLICKDGEQLVGTSRVIIRPGYDHIQDLISLLDSDKSEPDNTPTPTGSFASRYYTTPAPATATAMSLAIVRALRTIAAGSMHGTSTRQVVELLKREFGNTTSMSDLEDIMRKLAESYRVTTWKSRSGGMLVGPFPGGPRNSFNLPRPRLAKDEPTRANVVRGVVYETIFTRMPSEGGITEPEIQHHAEIKLERSLDPTLIGNALDALLLDEHIAIIAGTAFDEDPAIYGLFGADPRDHPLQRLSGWRGSNAL